MFNRYFHDELTQLHELGAEFSKAHPAVAPMLSGPSADPDVERLLEGTAFLTALLRQKLDDEFPEITHDLMQLLQPHYLRPIPSSTLIAFKPKPTLNQPMTIPAGVHVASVPVEGESCLFRTCYDVELHPLTILDAAYSHPPGRLPLITVLMELKGQNVSTWKPEKVRFFLSGDYVDATEIYSLLRTRLKRVIIKPQGGAASCELAPDCLKPLGFSDQEALIPYPAPAYPGYRLLQEYFILPQKFLFLELTGWERWTNRGNGARFELIFELEDAPVPVPRVQRGSFTLAVTPAVNIFPREADPILLDHRKTDYLVRPDGSSRAHYQTYSVEQVTGYLQGTAEERTYVPYEFFRPDAHENPVYHTTRKGSPLHDGFDVYLSVAYPRGSGAMPAQETLSLKLLCTNGSLPSRLQTGDLRMPTDSSPEFADFSNILPPTASVQPPLGANLHWRLLSHLSVNYRSLARTENLKALLELYIFPDSRDQSAVLANKKRINGIQGVDAKPSNRLSSGSLIRGLEITLRMRDDHFAGQGDLYLFGCVLDHFLGGYMSLNSYTELRIHDIVKGKVLLWPARLGTRHLL